MALSGAHSNSLQSPFVLGLSAQAPIEGTIIVYSLLFFFLGLVFEDPYQSNALTTKREVATNLPRIQMEPGTPKIALSTAQQSSQKPFAVGF